MEENKTVDLEENKDAETEALGNFLSNSRSSNSVPNIDDKLAYKIKKSDHDALNSVLLEILSPELSKNEEQKRLFKERLMKYIIVILSIQLGFFLFFVLAFTIVLCLNCPIFNKLSLEQLKDVIKFLEYYISATAAEFIAMLFFIVKFVFDKSIVSLIKDLFNKDDK